MDALHDSYSLVYFIFVLLGTGVLLPWNVYITEAEFFFVRLHQSPIIAAIADNFMSYFGMAYTGTNLLLLAVLIRYQKYLSARARIVYPLTIFLFLLVADAVVALKTGITGRTMALFTLPALSLMGAATAVIQGGLLGLASRFSPMYIQGAISGQAVAGLLTSSLSFLSQLRAPAGTAAHTPADVAPAAFLYFALSALVIVACMFGYMALWKIPYSRRVMCRATRSQPGTHSDARPSLPHPATATNRPPAAESVGNLREALLGAAEDEEASAATANGRHASMASDGVDGPALNGPGCDPHPDSDRLPTAFLVYCACGWACCFATLAVFPGISASICSLHNSATTAPCAPQSDAGRLAGDLFVPIMFLLFNIGDLLGRLLAGLGPWSRAPPAPVWLVIYSIARLLFLVLFPMCHVVTAHKWLVPDVFTSDAAPLLLNLTLGITQGHLMTTVCMHGATLLPDSRKAIFGPTISFATTSGLFTGSFLDMVLVRMLQGA